MARHVLLFAFLIACSDGAGGLEPSLFVGDELSCVILREAADGGPADAEPANGGDADAMDGSVSDADVMDGGVADAGADASVPDGGTPLDAGVRDGSVPDAAPVRSAGVVRCWGQGQATPLVPTVVLADRAEALVLGGDTNCALRGGVYRCWGESSRGQFARAIPVEGVATALPLQVSELKIARFGGAFLCGVVNERLQCWGAGDQGQLGRGLIGDSDRPDDVELPGRPQDFALGETHACAIVNAELFCWGSSADGRLGLGRAAIEARPVNVILPEEVSAALASDENARLALGRAHSCLMAAGGVYCWGDDSNGQLGQSARGNPAGPVLTVDVQAVQIASGPDHVCASASDGTVRCWGEDADLRLGSDQRQPLGPVLAEVTGPVLLGERHGCTLQGTSVLCWGAADEGQLGTARDRASTQPVAIAGLR